jgi:hypothetical protein
MKLSCQCGAAIYDGTDDLPHKAHFIPDQLWTKLFDDIDVVVERHCATPAERDAACTKLRALIGAASRTAWQCTACGRLHLDDLSHRVRTFRPDASDTPSDVFKVAG